jgi:hypothetical protein
LLSDNPALVEAEASNTTRNFVELLSGFTTA